MISNNLMALNVEDFTGQVRRRASGIPRTATVSDLVESLRTEMQLPDQDAQGRPIQYGAQSPRGDVLNATDQLGEVLDDEEVVILTKSVTAGGGDSRSEPRHPTAARRRASQRGRTA